MAGQIKALLLVEDDANSRRSIKKLLGGSDVQISEADQGQTALDLLKTQHFDCMILDLSLPDMDGVDLCRTLRQEAHKVMPVLMLTVRNSLENKLEGFNAGADDYLTKPFALQELAARVKALTKPI